MLHPIGGDLSLLRVLHLSDLHIERISERDRRLNKLRRELAPDFVLFPGDLLSLSGVYDPRSQRERARVRATMTSDGFRFRRDSAVVPV